MASCPNLQITIECSWPPLLSQINTARIVDVSHYLPMNENIIPDVHIMSIVT
jgi:hypothetical protein